MQRNLSLARRPSKVGSCVGVGELTGASNEIIHVRKLQITMLY